MIIRWRNCGIMVDTESSEELDALALLFSNLTVLRYSADGSVVDTLNTANPESLRTLSIPDPR